VTPLVRLWLDDLRDPNMHGHIGWTWAKTADDAIAMLASGVVVQASLDHDLTVSQTMGTPDGEKTGYTVACWMEENGVWPRDGVRCHSMNPVGRQRIEAVIRKANDRVSGPQPAQEA
jgi:hypothetical protein